MGIKFNAEEVFAMAIRIEKNGKAFYEKAAKISKDAQAAEFFKGLAAMEEEHMRIFGEMSRSVSAQEKESTAYDPDGEAALYLEALANSHGGEGSPQAAGKLTGAESVQDILRTGMELEKKSILFYMGLEDLVSDKLGKGKVARIIGEEKGHLAVLARALRTMKG